MSDRELLIKLLNMTASKHDGEVLSAIRKSNDLLRRNQVNWSDLLASAPRTEPVRTREHRPDFHDLHGSATARSARRYRTTGTREAPDFSRSQTRSIPLLLRIPLLPLWLAGERYPDHAAPGRTKVARGTAMLIAVSMYLLCFGLSVVVLKDAFRF